MSLRDAARTITDAQHLAHNDVDPLGVGAR